MIREMAFLKYIGNDVKCGNSTGCNESDKYRNIPNLLVGSVNYRAGVWTPTDCDVTKAVMSTVLD
jgi:hypothetical protein